MKSKNREILDVGHNNTVTIPLITTKKSLNVLAKAYSAPDAQLHFKLDLK